MKRMLFLLLCLAAQDAVAQQTFVREPRDHVWLFGSQPLHTRVEFHTSPPTVFPETFPLRLNGALGIICDAEGELQFYSNGIHIHNHLHQPMEGGTWINPGTLTNEWSTHGLPAPQLLLALHQRDSRYILLHNNVDRRVDTLDLYSKGFLRSTIDMAANEGAGRVVEKNVRILPDTIDRAGKITAVRHANGRDWWVVVGGDYNNLFHRVLVTPDTVQYMGAQAIGQATPSGVGQGCFSPDGTKYARLNLVAWGEGEPQYIDLYDFDRCTGTLSNPGHFIYSDWALVGGLAFSENSRFLYVASWLYLYQMDTEAEDVFATFQQVGDIPPDGSSYFVCQLGPDGRIYVSTSGTKDHVHIVDTPNRRGAACGLQVAGLPMDLLNWRTMANHPYYGLGPLDGSPCDTLGIDNPLPVAAFEHTADTVALGVEFFDASAFATGWVWDLGDGTASTARHPTHTYPEAGEYTVCLTAANATGTHTHCGPVRVGLPNVTHTAAQPAPPPPAVWPNPAAHTLHIRFAPGQAPATLWLADLHGRPLRHLPAPADGHLDVDVAALPAGLYWLVAVGHDGHRVAVKVSILH